MSTSGVVTLTFTAMKLVEMAFSKMGVKIAEQALEAFEYQDGQDALNIMIKAWGAQGLHLWSREEGVLFLDAGKSDYLLGATGDEACLLDDFVSTNTTVAKIATDTVIDVSDTTGMVAADFVGIALDDNTRHWTTIVSVDSPVQITITTGLLSGAASGATVFTYTNLAQRPERVTSCRRKIFNNDNEIPMLKWSRSEYFDQVNKNSQGTSVNWYYSPLLGNGRMYVWQTASSINDLIRFSFQRPLEIVTNGDETIDFPSEWNLAIIYGIANILLDDYDVPFAKGDRITNKADIFLDEILGWDSEDDSINLQPDFN